MTGRTIERASPKRRPWRKVLMRERKMTGITRLTMNAKK